MLFIEVKAFLFFLQRVVSINKDLSKNIIKENNTKTRIYLSKILLSFNLSNIEKQKFIVPFINVSANIFVNINQIVKYS